MSGAVALRPIGPDDRERLRAAFERLSPESRYRRFFAAVPRLSERELDYLTRIDHHDHEAIVALGDQDDIVGVARFVRTAPQEAEPAIVVVDDRQGEGIGGALLDTLVSRARQEGIVRFRAPVLAHNDAAIQAFSRLGDTVVRPVGSEVELEIALRPERTARRRLLELLRRAAGGSLASGSTLLQQFEQRAPAVTLAEQRNTIVVCADSEHTVGPIVAWAAEVARALGASLQLVAARWPVLESGDELERAVNATADALRRNGLEVDVHVRRGSPAAAVVDVAAQQAARLIVIGAPPPARAARLLPGDVASTVARQAPCDVLMARGRPPT